LAQICTKSFVGWGFAPDPTGGAYSAPPDPLAGLRGPTSKGRERKGREGKGKEGEGRGKGGREGGRKRKGRGGDGEGEGGEDSPPLKDISGYALGGGKRECMKK